MRPLTHHSNVVLWVVRPRRTRQLRRLAYSALRSQAWVPHPLRSKGRGICLSHGSGIPHPFLQKGWGTYPVSSGPAGTDPDPGARRRPLVCKGAFPMADYIPGGDAEFNAWLDNFVT